MDESDRRSTALLQWYEGLSTRRVDLVGDYAGNELFLVEGDSLLLNCMSDPLLDFHDGFQLLHAVFLVERFLHNLARRKCNFHIVFFDSHANLCVPPPTSVESRPKYELARSVIIAHLRAHLPAARTNVKLFTFDSLQDVAFKKYLRVYGTYFIMCHDGAIANSMVQFDLDSENADATNAKSSEEETRCKITFRYMIFNFIAQGYNVALVNGLEWLDTKVMTFVLEGHRKLKGRINLRSLELDKQEDSAISNGYDLEDNVETGFSRLSIHVEQKSAPSKIKGDSPAVIFPKEALRSQIEILHAIQDAHFTQRGILTVLVLSHVLNDDATLTEMVSLLLAHVVMLESLALSKRRLTAAAHEKFDPRLSSFLQKFSSTASFILMQDDWIQSKEVRNLKCDIADLIDGRLLCTMSDMNRSKIITGDLALSFDQYAQALQKLSGVHVQLPGGNGGTRPSVVQSNGVASNKLRILPFSNLTFDKHLVGVKITVDERSADRQMGRIHKEISHWHNAKRPLIVKAANPVDPRQAKRIMKRNDFFMAEMQSYAASLTNATGKSLEPEIVTVSEKSITKATHKKEAKSEEEQPTSSNTHTQSSRKGKDAGKKGTAKQALMKNIATNKAAKDKENVDKIYSAWRVVRTDLAAEKSLRSQYFKMVAYLDNLSEARRGILKAEVLWNILSVLLTIYSLYSKKKDTEHASERYGTVALLFDTVRTLTKTEGLTKTIAVQLQSVVKALQLPNVDISIPLTDRELAYDPKVRVTIKDELGIGLETYDFQLKHLGPYMDRNLDSAPDSRVPFEPDGWQRKVLDELDEEKSVFVVAPTSAGKTFISFYAMERILRAGDDGVLVYVAPTKALVNQIAAEIQARFRKTYKYAGKSVWAIHTRDYRINNPTGCQILVTVPHILQIMLLAPSNAKTWAPRVKYIIFDEIHSIGQAEDGVVWEQLLLLAPCPIIALSATVGNPQSFNSWLTSTQKSIGHQLTMIQHQHRYSDLRKFVFQPPKKFAFCGLNKNPTFGILGLDGLDGLQFLHPVASLVDRSRGMPDDLSLEARDCYSLFKSMAQFQTKQYPVDPALDPANGALPKIIAKKDIIEWEMKLKTALKVWMANDDSPFESVLEDLSKPLSDPRKESDFVSNKESPIATDVELQPIDPDDIYATTLPLLCQLQERAALPAIFFNYERFRCERMCQHLIQQLEAAETKFKQTNPAWKKKVAAFEEWKKLGAAKKQEVKATAGKKSKTKSDEDGGSKLDRLQEASTDANPFEGFDPLDPIDGYHFAATHKVEAGELERHFFVMKKKGLPQWLMDGLRRGIGVHHAGMNRKYRQVVEMLFRKGFLRVVIATGTLALGINMPCATVVFSGDSVFLTALNFRQAAGRAGRRGFDLLGNVVFQGLSTGKICRLLSSRLPDLNGHFPITTTLVLRLFTLLHESKNAPYAVRAINALLSQPRLYLDGPAFKDQVLHHLRFSIEYLRRQELLSSQGAPIDLAGLTSHLYFTENSSFALNALFKSGYFHELCSEIRDKESYVLRTLMLTMAHLFGRRQCRQADTEYIENIVKRSSSIVFLPPLPPKAAQILVDHNNNTLDVFTTYVRTFADQHISTEDTALPLTGINFGTGDNDFTLPYSLPRTTVRSAFVALSGHSDKFSSISDLCRTTRSGVFLEEAVIPHLNLYPAETKTPLNAYLLDFFMHGDLTALEKGNGVRKSDVWFLLNDFSMVLATVIASLANFLKRPDSDLNLDGLMGQGDDTQLNEDDVLTENLTDGGSTTGSTTTNRTTTSTGASSLSSKKSDAKKAVLESWDDDAGGSDDDENSGDDIGKDREEDEEQWNDDNATTKEELERGFLDIYKAFQLLRRTFDEKFRKIFA